MGLVPRDELLTLADSRKLGQRAGRVKTNVIADRRRPLTRQDRSASIDRVQGSDEEMHVTVEAARPNAPRSGGPDLAEVETLAALFASAPASLRQPSREHIESLLTLSASIAASPRETVLATDAVPIELGARGLHVLGTLGQGGMGVVQLAVQRSLGREVAAKTLKPEGRNEEAKAQLAREALVTGALEHPNIVPVHDVTMEPDGTPVVVLKRIEGRSWDALLAAPDHVEDRRFRRDPLAWHLGVLIAVCKAIELAHERGILHRDLKPGNVMVGRHGEVYVVDWGIAATVDANADPRLPRVDRRIVGTPAYIAPEMLLGDTSAIGRATDVYLLGAVLYELVAGHPPHHGGSLALVIASAMQGPPPLPTTVADDLRAICARAMERAPAARFASVAELRAALEDHLEHRASAALAREAERELDALLELLRAGGAVEREAAQRAFGECRFGFMHALSTWEGNEPARRGLDRALAAMAELELDAGRTDAAIALLDEAREVPPALRERVERAARLAREERALLDELARRQQQMDPRVGRIQRTAFGLFAALVWVLTPLIPIVRVYHLGRPQQPWELRTWPFVMAAGFAIMAFVLRRALLATSLNRRVMGTAIATMVGFGLFHIGALRLGLSIDMIQGLDLFYYGVGAAALAAYVDPRFLAAAAVYVALFFSDMARPELRYYGFFVGNVALVLNLMWVWPPWRPDEPRGEPNEAQKRGG